MKDINKKEINKNKFKKVKSTFETNHFDLKQLIIYLFVLQKYSTFGHYYLMRLNFVSDQLD
jgi:hypothetical protein